MEQQAEKDAEALNNENFKVPQIPLRRSTRNTKAPTHYTDQPTQKIYDSNFNEVSDHCRQKHKGLGCAAIEANHFPDYYDSAETVL